MTARMTAAERLAYYKYLEDKEVAAQGRAGVVARGVSDQVTATKGHYARGKKAIEPHVSKAKSLASAASKKIDSWAGADEQPKKATKKAAPKKKKEWWEKLIASDKPKKRKTHRAATRRKTTTRRRSSGGDRLVYQGRVYRRVPTRRRRR